jgi:RNA polymerase-binding transcription factor DksA
MPFQELKRRLLSRKLELELQVAAIERDFAMGRSADTSEQAQERENEEVLNAIEQKDLFELKQIEQALTRIEDGSYEQCARCGANINVKRLKIIPFTEHCIKCAK